MATGGGGGLTSTTSALLTREGRKRKEKVDGGECKGRGPSSAQPSPTHRPPGRPDHLLPPAVHLSGTRVRGGRTRTDGGGGGGGKKDGRKEGRCRRRRRRGPLRPTLLKKATEKRRGEDSEERRGKSKPTKLLLLALLASSPPHAPLSPPLWRLFRLSLLLFLRANYIIYAVCGRRFIGGRGVETERSRDAVEKALLS